MARVKVEMPTDEEDHVASEEAMESNIPKKQRNKFSPGSLSYLRSQKTALIIGISIVLLLSLLLINTARERDQLKQQLSNNHNAGIKTEDEATVLKREINQFIELPIDEKPTVATVTDISKVKDQPFFAHAQNGDKVLLFSEAGKAILYRPGTKKIIELAPIDLKNPKASSIEGSIDQ